MGRQRALTDRTSSALPRPEHNERVTLRGGVDLLPHVAANRHDLRDLADSVCRLIAIGIAAGLSVGGWMLVFAGPWRIGMWVILLSAELLAVILWGPGEPAARA